MDKIKSPAVNSRERISGFFVLEGIDGSGTTTQLRQLTARAQQAGRPFRADCEPTPHPIGVLIRSILRREVAAHPASLAPLFAADRHEHIEGSNGVRAYLQSGGILVSDRYLFSSLAYQSQDLPWERVWGLNAAFPYPEAVFFLDAPVTVAQERIGQRGQARELFEDASLQEKIRQGYHRALRQAEAEGLEVVWLDASRPIDQLTDSIWQRICR